MNATALEHPVVTAAVVAAAYLGLVIAARWFLVAGPSRAHFQHKLDALWAEHAQVGLDGDTVSQLLTSASKYVPALRPCCEHVIVTEGKRRRSRTRGGHRCRCRITDLLFLRCGLQTAGWRLLHAAERRLVGGWTRERVNAEMRARKVKPVAKTLGENSTHIRAIARLVVAMERSHDRKDAEYERAASVQRRAFFLVCVLVATIPLAAWITRTPMILILGAIGGALSRAIWISKKERPSGNDYGLHWSAIFLAPLIGALCAASGLLLVSGAVAAGVAGETLRPVCISQGWSVSECTPQAAPTTALPETAGPDDVACDCVASGPTDETGGSDDAETSDDASAEDDSETSTTNSASAPPTTPPTPGATGAHGVAGALGPLAAMLAFLFGFSEKLFNRWIEQAQAAFDPDRMSREPSGEPKPGDSDLDTEDDDQKPTAKVEVPASGIVVPEVVVTEQVVATGPDGSVRTSTVEWRAP